MTYHLLDHCNRRNTAELARTDLDARALGTLEWVPPTEDIFVTDPVDRGVLYQPTRRFMRRHLGLGDKISCGKSIPAYRGNEDGRGHENNEDNITSSRDGYNVSHPFDEAHMIEAAAPHTPHDLHDDSEPDESALPKRHTPPNHGHGARCLCFFYAPNWDLSLVDPEIQGRRRMTAMVLSSGQRVIVHSASTGLVSPQDCEWCAGTGRIICDQDSLGGQREGRVSPSHKAGGYAEWQRRYANLVWGQIEGNRTFQVPLELAHIYATDGEPATTERE